MNLPLIGALVFVLMLGVLFLLARSNKSFSVNEYGSLVKSEEKVPVDSETLINILKDGNAKEKIAAIEKLVELAPPGCGQLLVEAMADKNEEVKIVAAEALLKMRDVETISLLVEALRNPGKWLPARVAEVLAAIGEPAVPVLTEAAADADEKVRAYVIQILGMINANGLEPVFQKGLQDSSVEVRRAAASVLAELKPAGLQEDLLAAVKDSDARVRIHAIKALSRFKDKRVLERLAAATEDDEWTVVASAIGALAGIGNEGEEILSRIAGDLHHPGQELALKALQAKGKKPGKVVNISYGRNDV
ncbi:PBS lyase HEAT domain-containing protein repeat-containing protein [Thermincola ferriacetica]|uniref:PBS lyase HEAT domain-containing protein repeat-containing protein n=1 Tax=Thermincola ferriacetica TaxID=281456 RepID=A0A0L6W2V9_9FIRM|nr:HEAT repeat domain-containing protein [Thermincola ferriacetica]KNZ69723.1 PBS lyase HEAT domain-containing protein repeat-containing protein [Thermincola ferriacetica]